MDKLVENELDECEKASGYLHTEGSPVRCSHDRLTEEGICRACGEDCRGIHS
jgi:hypothetical protein